MKSIAAKFATLGLAASMAVLPAVSSAQTRAELQRRQQMKNQWRNVAIGSAALGVLGLIKKDRTLTIAGAAGTAYGLHRYEQDRRSQRRLEDNRYSRNGNYNDRYSYYSRDAYGSSKKKNKKSRGRALGHYK
jgi:hypothetical protein